MPCWAWRLTRGAVAQFVSFHSVLDLWPMTSHLWCYVGLGASLQEQCQHLGVSLLCGQVDGADALLGHGVGVGSVLQQRRGNVHLVLLGSNVQRSEAILKISKYIFFFINCIYYLALQKYNAQWNNYCKYCTGVMNISFLLGHTARYIIRIWFFLAAMWSHSEIFKIYTFFGQLHYNCGCYYITDQICNNSFIFQVLEMSLSFTYSVTLVSLLALIFAMSDWSWASFIGVISCKFDEWSMHRFEYNQDWVVFHFFKVAIYLV